MDKRLTVIPAVLLLTVLAGFALRMQGDEAAVVETPAVQSEELRLVHQRFQQAVALLQHGEYDFAVQGFHEVLKVVPDMPEAHVNMGFALLGLEEYEAAASFFDTASTLRPGQTNAYYGLALAHEGLGQMREAVMAMQAYAHVAPEDDPYRRKAEAAIWEWEAALSANKNEE